MSKIYKVVGAISAVALMPFMAFAQEFGTTTAVTSVTSMISSLAVIIGALVGVILGLWAALVGLGWGVRKVKAYITGKKF
jgi:thiol:disulfide interchange protein